MEKPVLSPDFTIEDIHKLREYNYEITKHMTDKEWIIIIRQDGHFNVKLRKQNYRKCVKR